MQDKKRVSWKKKYAELSEAFEYLNMHFQRAKGLLMVMPSVFGQKSMEKFTEWYDDPSDGDKKKEVMKEVYLKNKDLFDEIISELPEEEQLDLPFKEGDSE